MFATLPEKHSALQRMVATIVLAHFLAAIAMTFAPRLHAFFHHDAQSAEHQCAVTDMVSVGVGDGAGAQPFEAAVILPQQFFSVAEFDPQWVASLFQSACVFEHAPPVVS